MKGNAYMSRDARVINAYLKTDNTQDVLIFSIEKDYVIHLKSEHNQLEIKSVFSALLECLLKQPITVALIIDSSYDNTLIKDVCKSYIDDLNRELDQIVRKIPKDLITNDS